MLKVISVQADNNPFDADDTDTNIWTFARIFGRADRADQIVLRTQTSVVLAWMDSVKTMEMLDGVLSQFPDSLSQSDVLRPGLALLVSISLHILSSCAMP